MHWDHEPIRFGPRAVPARSGRAKTRAWVIFQECWRGPHTATGDRSRSATSVRPTPGHGLVHGAASVALRSHWDDEDTPNHPQDGNRTGADSRIPHLTAGREVDPRSAAAT